MDAACQWEQLVNHIAKSMGTRRDEELLSLLQSVSFCLVL
jgi:hypothetical protein